MSYKLEPVGFSFPSFSFLCIFCSVCEFFSFSLSILSTRKKICIYYTVDDPLLGSFSFEYLICHLILCALNEWNRNQNTRKNNDTTMFSSHTNEIKMSCGDKILEAHFWFCYIIVQYINFYDVIKVVRLSSFFIGSLWEKLYMNGRR